MPRDRDVTGRFDKDFEYLMPFLRRIAEHAASAGGPGGDRLRALVEGEWERWGEIRRLVTGRTDAGSGAAEVADAVRGDGSEGSGRDARDASGGFTVGSLLSDRRHSGLRTSGDARGDHRYPWGDGPDGSSGT